MVRIFKHYIPLSLVLLNVLEIFIFWSAVPIARYLNHYDSRPFEQSAYTGIVFTLVVIFALASSGLYIRHHRLDLRGIFFRITLALLIVFFVMSFIFYMQQDLFTARTTFVYALAIVAIGLITTRTLITLYCDNDYLKQRVMVLGAGKRAVQINELKRKSDKKNLLFMGFVPVSNEEIKVKPEQIITIDNSLNQYVNDNRVDEIIVAIDDRRKNFPLDELLECKVKGLRVIDINDFFERQTGRIKLQSLNPSHLIFSDGFVHNRVDLLLKRFFDMAASFALLLITWPIMLITALAIMLESKFAGTVFYKQIRVGQNNVNFSVMKFRSMTMDAEKNGAQWAQKIDPRVTRVGAVLRKYRIDELPQLFNVIKGEMSFVGPRPERPEFVEQLSKKIKFYEIRHFVKPGITGWAQICYPYGDTEEDTRNKLEYDLYYMKNYSIFLDLMIMLQTIQVILWRQGSR
jgi:sugar transferase (PEP-CTERM system associated)